MVKPAIDDRASYVLVDHEKQPAGRLRLLKVVDEIGRGAVLDNLAK